MKSRTMRAAFTSRPSVGSSRKMTFGSVMKPRQKFMRWRWPVLRALMRAFALVFQLNDLEHFVDTRVVHRFQVTP